MTRGIPEVLRDNAQFRLLFAGQVLSVVGDRITFIAMPFAVLAIGGSAAQLGLVVAAQTIPFALLSLAAGVFADRHDRRKILIASDLVRMCTQLAAGLLVLSGDAEPWHLMLTAIPFGAADAFFMPAFSGLTPQLVPPRLVQQANALRGLTFSSSMVLGPAAAGALVALAGPGPALLVDAATFAASVGALAFLRPGEVVPDPDAEPEEGFAAQLRGGWQAMRSQRWIVPLLGASAVYHLIVLPSIYVLGPVLAEDRLGGAAAWATITVAFGAGAIAGDLLMLRWRPSRPVAVAAAFLIVASCQAAIIGSGLPLAGIAALECVTGIFVTGFFTLMESSIQERVPAHQVSRVSSYDYLTSVGLMPLGVALSGPVADAAGLQTTLVAMSAIGIAAALACLASPAVRAVRRDSVESTAPG